MRAEDGRERREAPRGDQGGRQAPQGFLEELAQSLFELELNT